ncbi:hypothetical protein Tco_0732690 [Tanacetum coccineum]
MEVDWQAEEERKRQREEEASKAAIAEIYDEVQVGIDADALFAAKLQQEERKEYTIEERAKFLAETIDAQRKFRAAQRFAEIRSRPPTKSQLRNLMMTYMKNMGGYKHYSLKQSHLKKSKERFLEEPDKVLKVESSKRKIQRVTKKRPGRRLKMKATKKSKRQKIDSDLEEEEQLKSFLMIVSLDSKKGEINYEVLNRRYPIVDWESKFYHTIDMENLMTITEFLELMEVQDISRLLLKWFQALAIPEQTAIGKEISNPFMAGSLLKTTKSMIGLLMYLTSSRPDIMFAVYAYARYQVNPKVSHLHVVKRIFRYLKGQPKLGLWYSKDSPFDLVAYTDSDYAGASLDRKSTTEGCQFLRCRLISWQCKKQTVVENSTTEAKYVAASSCCRQVLWIQNQLLDYGYNFMHTKIFIDNNRKAKKSVKLMMEKLFRMELELMLVTQNEVVHKELGDSLVRAATTASSLEAEHDSGNITKTRSKATPNESSSLRTTSGGGPKCQETMRDTTTRTRFESVSKHSNDSLLARGNTLQSDEDRLKLEELMALCTTLQNRVLDLEKTKTSQQNEIASLKRRVKKLEKKRNEDITLVNVQDDANNEMFNVNVLNGEEVFDAWQNENVVEEVVDAAQVSTAATTVTITTEEITLAQELATLKTSKPKLKGVAFQEPSTITTTTTTTTTTISSQQSQEKAEFDEEERLAREKAKKEKEANSALIKEWDDIQAKIDVDHQLAKRLQEQEELSDAEKATLFQQLLEKRRKHFAAKRAEEQRNNPPTQAQQRKIICTYLKNMEGKKLKDLKNNFFYSIQKMFDRAFKRVNTFVYFRTDLVEDPGASIRRHTWSYYPKRYWELLPKKILGAITQRDTGSYYPKRYWELLPKEILGAITQRDTGSYYPKRYWELLPKEILGVITQREIGMSYGKMEGRKALGEQVMGLLSVKTSSDDNGELIRGFLEALELKGGDGGACKLLWWLLGES